MSKFDQISGLNKEVVRRIKLVVFDFDGVFTDNHVLVSQDGQEFITCWRGDGIGLAKLKNLDIAVLVISTEINPVVSIRCNKLGVDCIQGCEDKLSTLRTLLEENKISMSETAFVGNDINDLSCLKSVGLPIVVADAHPDVMQYSQYITKNKGGKGAVREVCDQIEHYSK